jgi:hypothetical protein
LIIIARLINGKRHMFDVVVFEIERSHWNPRG